MTTSTPTPTSADEHAAKLDGAYATWIAGVESLDAFEWAAQSHASRGGHAAGFKARDEDSAKLIVAMGELAVWNRALLDVARAVIGRTNPHASTREWAAQAFYAARTALAAGFDDVQRRSGPEPYRYSDRKRAFRVDEIVAVLETIRLLTSEGTSPSLGWCARRFYETAIVNAYPVRMPPAVRRQASADEARAKRSA